MKTDGKFVLLEGREMGNRFFTTHTPGARHDVNFRILGYADTVGEAQDILYGKDFMSRLRAESRRLGGDGHV